MEEVKIALFDILDDNNPRPVSFGFCFFMKCWDIIKEDLKESAVYFFDEAPLPKFYSSTFIVIIPNELDYPSSFAEFGPISLSMVIY